MFIQHKRSLKDFTYTTDQMVSNTLSFENICNQTEYSNPDSVQVATTSRALRLFDNIVLIKLLDVLRNNSKIRAFSDDELKKYRFRPKYLSLESYGCTDYWWIILAVNGYINDMEFDNFSSLLLPDKDIMRRYIDNELNRNPISYETSK